MPSSSNKAKATENMMYITKPTTNIQNSIANPINAPMQNNISISI